MNRTDFIKELRETLKRLPPAEIENAIGFYEEYFNDAGPENERKVLEELGPPSAVAAKIIGEYAVNELNQKKPRHIHPLLLVLLGVFAAPVALPLAFAIVITAAVLIFALFVVFFALGVTAAAVVFQGLLAVFAGCAALVQSLGTGLFFIGYGLFCTAAGVAFILGIVKLSRITFAALQKALAHFLIRKGARQQ